MHSVRPGPPVSEVVEEARAAFARSEWETARDLFQGLVDEEPTGQALDGLGQALYWANREEEGIRTREKAFAAYSREGDVDAAANIAVYLAAEYRLSGNSSLANGWLGRASRLLERCGDCTARVWLHIELAKRATDPEEAEACALRALELARKLGDDGLEGAALGHAGTARIARGDQAGGMELLEEAMAIAIAAESDDPLSICDACCTGLVACDRLGDPLRALDWGRAISEFFLRRRFLPLTSWCRSIYAGFLISTGRWEEAERELQAVLKDDEQATGSHPHRAPALIRLADLRLRQGRLEESARLLAGLEDRAAALPTAVGLWLAGGELGLADEAVQRAAAGAEGNPGADLRLLEAAVELAKGDHSGSVRAADAALELATAGGRDDLAAHAALMRARADRLGGRQVDSKAIEGAIGTLAELGLPFEEAEARLELSRQLGSSYPRLAIEQARAALLGFEELGAARLADEAAGRLRELGAPGRAAPRSGKTLTQREQQVLELLGEGLSNPQIAERLVISPRTAEHHVRSVLAKLELSNRAEAAAYVARRGGPA